MILAKEDLEMIADDVIKGYREKTGDKTFVPLIENIAVDFLGLKVTFDKLSDDNSFCGLTAYEDTSIDVVIDGMERKINVKKNQIILDTHLVEIGKGKELCGKRRFTLAHEVAHQLLYQIESEVTKRNLNLKYSARRVTKARKLITPFDWNEWQANTLASALLMPRECVKTYMTNYFNTVSSNELTKLEMVNNFCRYFSVSKKAGIIRLERLGYLQVVPQRLIKEVTNGTNFKKHTKR